MKKESSLISIRNLSMVFQNGSNESLRVLSDVSLSVMAGDSVALTGANGSGKTTLMRIIAGELNPTSGSVFLDGKDCTHIPEYQRSKIIGRVYQESYKALASELTVEQTLSLAEKRNSFPSLRFPNGATAIKRLRGLSEGAAEFVLERKKTVTRTLSGGQCQLLALFVAILGQSRVLLLDEHMASLDEQFKDIANELVHAFLRSVDGTIIAITHDLDWVKTYTKRVAVIQNGTLTMTEGQKGN